MYRRCVFAGILTVFLASSLARGGEEAAAPAAEDPFAALINAYPAEVVKTGPSCKIVKIRLPDGVSADEIGGF